MFHGISIIFMVIAIAGVVGSCVATNQDKAEIKELTAEVAELETQLIECGNQLKGDVNGDGEITITDLTEIRLHLLGLKEIEQ